MCSTSLVGRSSEDLWDVSEPRITRLCGAPALAPPAPLPGLGPLTGKPVAASWQQGRARAAQGWLAVAGTKTPQPIRSRAVGRSERELRTRTKMAQLMTQRTRLAGPAGLRARPHLYACAALAAALCFGGNANAEPRDEALEPQRELRAERMERRTLRAERSAERLDKRGNRAEERLDRRGDRFETRMDRRSARAEKAGHDRRAERLDRLGSRRNERLDRKGERINDRLDRKAGRQLERADRASRAQKHRRREG